MSLFSFLQLIDLFNLLQLSRSSWLVSATPWENLMLVVGHGSPLTMVGVSGSSVLLISSIPGSSTAAAQLSFCSLEFAVPVIMEPLASFSFFSTLNPPSFFASLWLTSN
uniref:Secreted protein n=1 Tax=Opuntia streptacantha TaxID=393608 RepID=A0A7C9EVB6_OPUST